MHCNIVVCGVLTYFSWPPLLIQSQMSCSMKGVVTLNRGDNNVSAHSKPLYIISYNLFSFRRSVQDYKMEIVTFLGIKK